jgi:ATP/maltotriose-dependent transcriptional regulator MalT
MRARALIEVAAMATRSGDHSAGMSRASEAFTLCRSLGDTWGATLAQSYVATAAAEQRSWDTARPLIEDARGAFLALGDEYDAMLATWLLACVCRELGDHERSVVLLDENLRRAHELDNRRVAAMSLAALAMHAVDDDRIRDAASMLETAYGIDCAVGEADGIALDVCRFAYALLATGDVETSAGVLAKGESLLREIGATRSSIFAMEARVESTFADVRDRLDDSSLTRLREEGERLTADEAVALALSCLR